MRELCDFGKEKKMFEYKYVICTQQVALANFRAEKKMMQERYKPVWVYLDDFELFKKKKTWKHKCK